MNYNVYLSLKKMLKTVESAEGGDFILFFEDDKGVSGCVDVL
jgi:hypothetical protein